MNLPNRAGRDDFAEGTLIVVKSKSHRKKNAPPGHWRGVL